jgi:hypothetical protein
MLNIVMDTATKAKYITALEAAKELGVVLLAVLATQLGTIRGRCDENSGKFPSIMKPRFNRPVGERNHF